LPRNFRWLFPSAVHTDVARSPFPEDVADEGKNEEDEVEKAKEKRRTACTCTRANLRGQFLPIPRDRGKWLELQRFRIFATHLPRGRQMDHAQSEIPSLRKIANEKRMIRLSRGEEKALATITGVLTAVIKRGSCYSLKQQLRGTYNSFL
jgi:hypothetical protein